MVSGDEMQPERENGHAAERLHLPVESLADTAITLFDRDGFVRVWNRGTRLLNGFSDQDRYGLHFSRFFSEDDRAAGTPGQLLAQARNDGHVEWEGWRVRRDGSRYWVHAVIEPVVDEAQAFIGFTEITRDVSRRREAELALKESERRFRLLVQGVVDYSMFMLDPSGLVVNWNAGAERIKGYRAEEIVGRHFSTFYTKEDRAAGLPFRALEQAGREGRFEGEGLRVRKDGSRFWASVVLDAIRDETGALIGFAKITRDITERIAAQNALRDSERQFRLLVSGVVDYAVFMLDPNGVVTSWNQGGERIKGYKPHEIIGQHFSRFYTDQDRAAGVPAAALYRATTEGRYEAEGWRVRKDGNLFWASVVVDAIRDDNGVLVGFAKITRDVTERREAQRALQEANERLAHAQKMDALGQLTGGIAHDFNNLLTIISGQAQILRRHARENAGALRSAEAIEKAAARGEALTRRLLAFSRAQHLRPEIVDVAAMGASLETILSGSLTGSIELVVSVQPDVWPVVADAAEFELALVNLALNARDAMPEGGRLALTARNVTLVPGELGLALAGDFVAVTMADTGVGIPPDLLTKVFEPFFTTKPPGKGTGLGLAQTYGFAHQSGGAVTVESDVGHGTRITLFLPRAAATGTEAPAEPAPEQQGAARILVVEDNPEVAVVSARMLEELGHRVHVVHGGEAALVALDEAGAFDLVFTDVVMAGMDGIALANAIRARHPTMPILLTSGFTKSETRPVENWPLLRKPIGLAELNRAIGRLLHPPPGTPGTL
ncbi:MAG: PAS domain S-box protein, partial [Rhodospirillales bacterium]|nr:PAS domain S-box protein [Rhodospirillales bacterium]